jgi:uncharacterized protein YmfQ (DUF2313 family)
MTNLFQKRSVQDQADRLSDYYPSGELFQAAKQSNTNLRNFTVGLANEFFKANNYLRDYNAEYYPDETIKFLEEWESALGIPDDCFTGTGTNDERRTAILVKLAASGVQTANDFVELAAIFGFTVSVTSGIAQITFPLTFPFIFFDTLKEGRFTIVIEFNGTLSNVFPLTFPITFGDPNQDILECLFQKLKPANCDLIFLQI